MKFTDAVGSISIDASHLKEFVSTWYNEGDNIVISGFPVGEGPRRVLSMSISREDLLDKSAEELEGLTRDFDSGRKYDAYIGINPVIDLDTVTLYSRGTEENVKAVYGCFLDLDVNKPGKKSGAFESKDDALAFLSTIPVEPTLIVDNGVSGGVHAFWKYSDPIMLSENTPVKPYLVGWWSYANSLTECSIDRLVDTTRLVRMPSGIYWPKKDSDKFDTVKVIKNTGNIYNRDDLLQLSANAYKNHCDTLVRLRREKVETLDLSLDKYVNHPSNSERVKRLLNLRPHNEALIKTLVQNAIDENYSWADILEPYGWTLMKEDSEGSLVWSRPGKLDRSAVTDYRRDDGQVSQVMSLLSSSDETQLADLKEANIVLTKMQVLLRLRYNDNVIEMLDDILRRLEENEFIT